MLRSSVSMSRMLDLVRASAVSSHQMMTCGEGRATRAASGDGGDLDLPRGAQQDHGEQARLTLAGWDETTAKQMAANPDSPKEILDYWLVPKNIRPALFPLLLENPSVSTSKLGELGSTLKGRTGRRDDCKSAGARLDAGTERPEFEPQSERGASRPSAGVGQGTPVTRKLRRTARASRGGSGSRRPRPPRLQPRLRAETP